MNKESVINNGTVEQDTFTFAESLKELYIEQYGFEGLKSEEIDEKLGVINEGLNENSRNRVPACEAFVHERRKWFKKIIVSLVDEAAYNDVIESKKSFVFNKQSKNTLQVLMSNSVYYQPVRSYIMTRKYYKIEEEHIDTLRYWIKDLYQDLGFDEDKINEIIEKFNFHFSLQFREMQKDLFILTELLSRAHISQFSNEDYDFISQELQVLVDKVRKRMKMEKIDFEELKLFIMQNKED